MLVSSSSLEEEEEKPHFNQPRKSAWHIKHVLSGGLCIIPGRGDIDSLYIYTAIKEEKLEMS